MPNHPTLDEQQRIILEMISDLEIATSIESTNNITPHINNLMNKLKKVLENKSTIAMKNNAAVPGLAGALMVLEDEFKNQMLLIGVTMKSKDGRYWSPTAWKDAQLKLNSTPPHQYVFQRIVGHLLNQAATANKELDPHQQIPLPDLNTGSTPASPKLFKPPVSPRSPRSTREKILKSPNSERKKML